MTVRLSCDFAQAIRHVCAKQEEQMLIKCICEMGRADDSHVCVKREEWGNYICMSAGKVQNNYEQEAKKDAAADHWYCGTFDRVSISAD